VRSWLVRIAEIQNQHSRIGQVLEQKVDTDGQFFHAITIPWALVVADATEGEQLCATFNQNPALGVQRVELQKGGRFPTLLPDHLQQQGVARVLNRQRVHLQQGISNLPILPQLRHPRTIAA
jgi:hypothetical protein